jgi:glycosyltransferase involved in cell wall biosynthesis
MRVLHVLHTSVPDTSGYSIRSRYVLHYQQRLGIEPMAVTSARHPNGGTAEECIDGVRYWRTAPARGSLSRSASRVPFAREACLMSWLRRRVDDATRVHGPELIHAHSPVLCGLPGLSVARRVGLPFVYEVRDLWENASVDKGKFRPNSARFRVARALETYLVRRADVVTTICEGLARELVARGVPPERVVLTPNGVDAERFVPHSPDPALLERVLGDCGSLHCGLGISDWGLGTGATDRLPAVPSPISLIRNPQSAIRNGVIAYIGSFSHYEGLDCALRALPLIRQSVPGVLLLLVGDGEVRPELERLARELRVDGCVRFTGRLPHETALACYSLADLLVYPRVRTATTTLTTPLKPLEAMAMGKAVLASNLPAMREIVRDGENGILFRAGDVKDLAARATRLLENPALRAALGDLGRRFVLRERDWSRVASTYAALYEELCAVRGARCAARPAAHRLAGRLASAFVGLRTAHRAPRTGGAQRRP